MTAMSSREDSTLESVPNEYRQPGLEADTRNPPPTYSSEPIEKLASHQGERKILGLKKRLFVLVTTIAIILIVGAIVGGAVGGTLANKHIPTPTNSVSTTTTPPIVVTTPDLSQILPNSSIASVNWTHQAVPHYAVFYQNKNDQIFMSLWDGKTWNTSHVSDTTRQQDKITPRKGTTIAASVDVLSERFELNVYFYGTDSRAFDMTTFDSQVSPNKWRTGNVTLAPFQGLSDSNLAAYYQRCGSRNCVDTTVIVYQDGEGILKAVSRISSTGLLRYDGIEPKGNNLGLRTGIGIIPFLGAGDSYADTLKVYVENNDQLQEYTGRGTNWTIDSGFKAASVSTRSKIAATPLVNPTTSGWDILVVSLTLDNKLQSSRRIGSKWNPQTSPTLNAPPGVPVANFTDIAMNLDRRFYGISNGQIHEYGISTNPESWDYIGVVNTTSN